MSIVVRVLSVLAASALPLLAYAAPVCPSPPPMKPPVYPAALVAERVGGVTVLVARLDDCGRPVEIQVENSSGYVELDEAAVAAMRGWQLNPPVGEEGRRVRIPVNFDPSVLQGNIPGSLSELSPGMVYRLRQWANTRVPPVAADAAGRVPWNTPDPLPFPSGSIAEQLELLRQNAKRLPDLDAGKQQYEWNTEQGLTSWVYFPAQRGGFGPALVRQRLVSDGDKAFWVTAAKSEAGAEGERRLRKMLDDSGTQQSRPPPPPPPPAMLELLEQDGRQ